MKKVVIEDLDHSTQHLFFDFLSRASQSETQIREQMSDPDLDVSTLKFLALKKLVFPP